jgi:hypothetical protein
LTRSHPLLSWISSTTRIDPIHIILTCIPGGCPDDQPHVEVQVGQQDDRNEEENDEGDLVHRIPLKEDQKRDKDKIEEAPWRAISVNIKQAS